MGYPIMTISLQRALAIKENFSGKDAASPDVKIAMSFASAEHLAHTVAYDLYKNSHEDNTVDVYDADGEIRLYTTHEIVTDHLGIRGYILTGNDEANLNVHIVFRGTACKSSVDMDLEPVAPGHESFKENKKIILTRIQEVLNTFKPHANSIYVDISGHSLGGGMAQYTANEFLLLMMQAALQSDESAPWGRIGYFTVNHVNSAGVDKTTADSSIVAAKTLKDLRPELQISLRALRVAGDPVQLSAYNILADIDHGIVQVNLLKVPTSFEGLLNTWSMAATAAITFLNPMAGVATAGALLSVAANNGANAHRAHHFLTDANSNFEYFDNSTAEGKLTISKKLSK